MSSSKLLLPMVLGFSICGGAFIYIWLKRNTGKNGKKSVESTAGSAGALQIKLKSSFIPLLVGRGGANQRDIEDKTGARIHFQEEGPEGYITCYIKGNPEQIEVAKKQIEKMAKDNAEIRTEEMWVPHSACGRIMGRCGETLSDIMAKCNVKIVVDPPLTDARNDSQKRKLTLTGYAHHIGLAQSIIQEKIKEDAELRRSLDESLARREPRGPPLIVGDAAKVILPQREKLQPAGADGTMEVYVSALTSPYRFFMQLLGPQAAALDNLVETMTEYYGKEENRELHRIIAPQVGQIVAAMFNVDGKWYRAQVQEIKANDYVPCQPVLDLYFVDYGDNCYAGPLEVFELRPDFLTLRFQAIECYLANVRPPVDGDETVYPEESIEKFEQLAHVARWKKLWSRVVSYRERDGRVRAPSPSESLTPGPRSLREGSPVPGVELYDNESGRDINIAEELIRGGFARPCSPGGNSGFGDLGKSKVLNDTKTSNDKPQPIKEKSSTPEKNQPKIMKVNEHKVKNDIVEETKSFIDSISADAENAVENVKKSAPESGDDTVQSVKDRVAKVQSQIEQTKSFIDGISKDSEKVVEDIKKSTEDAKGKVKERLAKTKTDKPSVKFQKSRSDSKDSSDSLDSPKKTPLKSDVDFMPSFGKPVEKTKNSSPRQDANDFLSKERNGTTASTDNNSGI